MKIRFISAEAKDEKKFLWAVIVRSCYCTAFVPSCLGKSLPVDVDGLHHSYIIMLIQKAQLLTRLVAKLMNVQEGRTRINVKAACGHYATMAYEVNGDRLYGENNSRQKITFT
jgi:hypothetical protein